MTPNTRPDTKAAVQAALQKAGVPFNKAMSVSSRELARAALDPQWFNRLVRELTPKPRKEG
jgi:hypothetical protein